MKKKSPTPKRTHDTNRRKAVASTWQPSTRTSRTITTRFLQYRTPQQLIADAAALVPDHVPWRVHFASFAIRRRPSMSIDFYVTDSEHAQGIRVSVHVVLRMADVPTITAFLMRLSDFHFEGMMFCELPDSVGDGGEELPVPKISRAELAVMRATTEAIQ